MGIDALLAQFVGKIFVVCAQQFWLGGIVKSYHDGVLADAQVPFQAFEEMTCQVGGVLSRHRGAEALAQLMDRGLGEQRHRQLCVADI